MIMNTSTTLAPVDGCDCPVCAAVRDCQGAVTRREWERMMDTLIVVEPT